MEFPFAMRIRETRLMMRKKGQKYSRSRGRFVPISYAFPFFFFFVVLDQNAWCKSLFIEFDKLSTRFVNVYAYSAHRPFSMVTSRLSFIRSRTQWMCFSPINRRIPFLNSIHWITYNFRLNQFALCSFMWVLMELILVFIHRMPVFEALSLRIPITFPS